jgi:hypothetical protein
VAELKHEHGLDRARCRGTNLFHVQLLLGCTALNVKRLASRSDAASGEAAESATAQADSENAASDSTWAADRAHNSASAHHSAPADRPRRPRDMDDHPLDELTARSEALLGHAP